MIKLEKETKKKIYDRYGVTATREQIEIVLSTLTEREKIILRKRLGLEPRSRRPR